MHTINQPSHGLAALPLRLRVLVISLSTTLAVILVITTISIYSQNSATSTMLKHLQLLQTSENYEDVAAAQAEVRARSSRALTVTVVSSIAGVLVLTLVSFFVTRRLLGTQSDSQDEAFRQDLVGAREKIDSVIAKQVLREVIQG